MAWASLAAAGLSELALVSALGRSDGFRRLLPTLLVAASAAVSFFLLSLAIQAGVPASTAYAVWVGIGAVGAVVLGVTRMGERLAASQLLGIAMVIVGVITLKLVGG